MLDVVLLLISCFVIGYFFGGVHMYKLGGQEPLIVIRKDK